MSTIVEHKKTGQRYALVGTGFGAYRSSVPHWFLGPLAPEEKQGTIQVVAVSDHRGEILWFASHSLKVVSIDGVEIAGMESIAPRRYDDPGEEAQALLDYCPRCSITVRRVDEKCGKCGLDLTDHSRWFARRDKPPRE